MIITQIIVGVVLQEIMDFHANTDYLAKNGFTVKLSDVPSRWHLDYDIGNVFILVCTFELA